jgi:hypothetical protein
MTCASFTFHWICDKVFGLVWRSENGIILLATDNRTKFMEGIGFVVLEFNSACAAVTGPDLPLAGFFRAAATTHWTPEES